MDRLEKLGPVLESASYGFVYSTGPGKKHGCIVAYRRNAYELLAERTVVYDNVEVRPEGITEQARKASSFRTKNIGLIVALKKAGDVDQPIVVATTHLFWHPKYTYERARQALILMRSACDFRESLNLRDSPCFIAGGVCLDNCCYKNMTYEIRKTLTLGRRMLHIR